MATERLRVILQLAAGQYKREAREAAQATGRISAEAKNTTTAFGGLRSGMKAIGPVAAIAGAAATAAIGKFAIDSRRSASNLNESINAIRVTFGEAADDIFEIGESSATSFGLAKSEFNAFAVQFSSFGKTIAGGTGQSVSGVIEDLTTRISDFASVMNLEVPGAAEKFQSGLAGQTEPLQRFGIDVSAARVEQELLSRGLIDGTRELTQQEKVLGRYLTIMAQTETTAGDFANTSGELANQQRIFGAELENARAEIGEELLPVMTDLITTGRDLIPIVKELGQFLGVLGKGLALTLASNEIERVAIASGGAAESAAALATAIVQVTEGTDENEGSVGQLRRSYEKLIEVWDGNTDEVLKLRNGLDFLVDSGELTERQARVLAGLLEDELSRSFDEARGAAHDFERGGRGAALALERARLEAEGADKKFFAYAEGLDAVAASADIAAPNLREVADQTFRINQAQLEAISPITNAIGAVDRLKDAQEKLADTAPGTEDYARALVDVGVATAEVNEAIAGLGGGNLERGIEALARALGRPTEELEEILRLLGIIDSEKVEATVLVKFQAGGDVIARRALEEGGAFGSGKTVTIDPADTKFFRHSGGPIDARTPYIIRPDEEVFVSRTSGDMVLNDKILAALQNLGGRQVNYNIPITSTGSQTTDAQLVGSIASVLRRMETI